MQHKSIVLGVTVLTLLFGVLELTQFYSGRKRQLDRFTIKGSSHMIDGDVEQSQRLKISTSEEAEAASVSPSESENNGSRILYLLQTESCLPSYLKSAETIGEARSCHCDVLVLSYKQPCNETPLPHVEYLFKSSPSSWGSGRNYLYDAAKKRDSEYQYYIFVDDDLILRDENGGNPWRGFEDFLRTVEPAIGALDIVDRHWLGRAQKGRLLLGCEKNISSDYISVADFDAAFNAFHREAIDYVLPYLTRFDSSSWMHAAIYAYMKIEIAFAGQAVLHTRIDGTNPKHRPYARKWPTANDWHALVEHVRGELPKRYQNTSLLLEWEQQQLKHEYMSHTVCLPPPAPHTPIQPYKYVDSLERQNS